MSTLTIEPLKKQTKMVGDVMVKNPASKIQMHDKINELIEKHNTLVKHTLPLF